MIDLLKKFKEDGINPAIVDDITHNFKYTNSMFRKGISTFNLNKVFGATAENSGVYKESPPPQNA
jgi:hypothetical protein